MIINPRLTLTYDQAERVGERLSSRWPALTGQKAPAIKEEAWRDIVQAVMRWAGDEIEAGTSGEEA